ncbi:type II toxin-antitoxin system RelE/ParE family toxin [Halotia wernerae UHCC 0503]|nr:type II toxin-antitoxin system RelE/ParE family toxin [Halotia wernerae UHCC 0503]
MVLKLEELALEPRPDGVVKLEGAASLYRVRLGKYRIVYQIQDELLLVTVVKVAHRREVYRE